MSIIIIKDPLWQCQWLIVNVMGFHVGPFDSGIVADIQSPYLEYV